MFRNTKSETSIKAEKNRSDSQKSFSYDDTENDNNDIEDEDLHIEIPRYYKNSFYINEIKEENVINLVLEKEAYCFDVKLFAEKFVEAIFIEANKALMQDDEIVTSSDSVAFQSAFSLQDERVTSEKHSTDVKFKNSSVKSSASSWPKISEFNVKFGVEKIQNYIEQWRRSDDWKFHIEFLGFECEDCSNIFVYEVEWSKPTMLYPIPQTTASVYFAMEVYKMVPYNYDRCIEVSYVFECSSVIHRPGKINFQEKWLEDIIEAKLKFFKTITFSVPKGYCDKSTFEIPQILK